MGIVNYTNDSFYDGGINNSLKNTLLLIEKMLVEGADIIDVGGQSTRPNATFITSNEEWKRISKLIVLLKKEFPSTIFSIDTFWSNVAKNAVNEGFSIINDISGGSIDINMFETVGKLGVPYILTHMLNTPQKMQENPKYNDIVYDINYYFSKKINLLKKYNINDIILDVGFGFGKTIEHNFQLLYQLNIMNQIQNLPLLIGISRKSFIYKTLYITPQQAINGTTALHMVALQKGANILRVHDVKEAKECIELFNVLNY